MKIIEPGKIETSLVRCPHCEALLEIDKIDVSSIKPSMSLEVFYSVVCPECGDGISLKITDLDDGALAAIKDALGIVSPSKKMANGEFKLLKED